MNASKTILVTGASSGFGKLAAQAFLQQGHRVIAAVRGGAKRMPADKFSPPQADRLQIIDLHLEKSETFQEAVSALHRWSPDGRLDVLVNNAGYGVLKSVPETTEAELRHQFEVNFFGTALLTQKLLPFVVKGKGKILTVSSVVGLYSLPGYGAYSASKHAVEAYFEALRAEVEPMGVKSALIEPGSFRTDFASTSLKHVGSDSTSMGIANLLKQKAHLMGDDPGKVARLMVNLINKNRLRPRYLVGKDAWMFHLIFKFMPDSLRVWVTSRAMAWMFSQTRSRVET